MNDDIREFMVDLKGGLDRIEGKIDSNTAWMVNHAKEHAVMGKQRGAATVWGKIAAFFAGVAVLLWPPRH
jgi:hypothetical protein